MFLLNTSRAEILARVKTKFDRNLRETQNNPTGSALTLPGVLIKVMLLPKNFGISQKLKVESQKSDIVNVQK